MVLFPVIIGVKVSRTPKFSKLDRDRAGIGASLQDRDGKFAAHQEAGFFAVGGDEIRLVQGLQHVALLQRLDQRAQVQIRPEGENIQGIRNAECGVDCDPPLA